MDKKRVDESWKDQVERERATPAQPGAPAPEPQGKPSSGDAGQGEIPQARFDIFLSGLAMEALLALGEMPHPQTGRTAVQLPQARYVIDLLGLLEEKTRGNLDPDETKLITDTLYQLRMRYLQKTGGAPGPA
ncbi:MAG TPA: DUF1844 domain-containing protein [bacterium]